MKSGQPLNQMLWKKFQFQTCFYFKITNKELCTYMLYSVAFFKFYFVVTQVAIHHWQAQVWEWWCIDSMFSLWSHNLFPFSNYNHGDDIY